MKNQLKLIASSQKNPCPICDRTKDGDCRFNDEIVLCHTYVDGDVQKEGYVYRGATDDGLWGQYFPAVEPIPKAIRPKATKEFFYPNPDGTLLVRVTRKDDGNGKKTFSQSHWNGQCWVYGLTDEAKAKIHLYRIFDPITQQAITDNQLIFIVEGEDVANTLLSLGIAATTAIGGAGKWTGYGHSNYITDLKGARVVICPDCDKKGLQHSDAIAKDFPDAQWCYANPKSPSWERIPDNSGLDMGDWVTDLKHDGLRGEQIRDRLLGAVEPQRVVKQAEPEAASKSAEAQTPHFESNTEGGLVWVSYEKDEETGEFKRSKTKIGNHLKAIAYIENIEESGAALLLEFQTVHGAIRRWQMPRLGLASNPAAIVDNLMARSYFAVWEQKKRLIRYVAELGKGIEQRYTLTDSTGWVNGSFVTPIKTYGNQSIRFREVDPNPATAITETVGTLEGWIYEVATPCTGNSRLIFALGTVFAAPLLPIVGLESGGFHLVGGTSQGKTTTLSVAASVGGLKTLPHWRTTVNGLESTATAFNHSLLPLDEIGQAEARDVGAIAYMLANGQGKARMRRDLTHSTPAMWQLLFLSSGEVTLAAYLKQAGITIKGGQEVRLTDLPACPKGSQYGVFENIGTASTAEGFVNALERATRNHRGTALDSYLTQLQAEHDPKGLTDRTFQIAALLANGYTDTAISRVSKRFALVQVALEVAHSYSLLPFPIEQCGWAVKTLFTDWVDARGGDGSLDLKNACDKIEHLFVSNEFSDRVFDVDGDQNQTVRNLLAYKKNDVFDGAAEFWVPTAVFNAEFAVAVDKTALIAELLRREWLKPSTEPGRHQVQRKLKTQKVRVYVFKNFWNYCSETGTTGTVGTEIQNPELEGVPVVPTSAKTVPTPQNKTGTTGTDSPKESIVPIGKKEGMVPVVPSAKNGRVPDGYETNPVLETVSDVVPVVPTVPVKKHEDMKFSEHDIDWEVF